MSITKDNKFVSLLLILVSLFILLFFTKGIFYEIQEKKDTRFSLENKLSSQEKELNKLNALENDLKSGEKQEEISRFKKGFSEDEMIKYIHNYVEKTNTEDSRIIIKSLSFSKSSNSEIGFKESGVTINARVSDKETMKRFLLFLTNKNASYTFYITNFSFPNDGRAGEYDITIPLKLFHK